MIMSFLAIVNQHMETTMQKKQRFLIYLESYHHEWLQAKKQKTGASKAEIVRRLIDRERNKNQARGKETCQSTR